MNRAEETFDDWARRGRDRGMEEGHLPRARKLLDRMRLQDGTRGLDLGCGNGWAGRWMLARNPQIESVTGLDIARTMIAKAEESAPPKARYLRAALESLPFAEAEFHEAFSMEALYYATDLHACLSEIRRVLVPGGRLYFGTDFFEENPYSASWPTELHLPMQRLSEAGWRSTLQESGFGKLESFRSLDPRPIDPNLDDATRRETEDFRQHIGTLCIIAEKV